MRYGLWGVFGTLNFGNEATLRAVIENLPRFDDAASFLIIAAQPRQATLEHGLEAVSINGDPELGLPPGAKTTRFPKRLWREIRDLPRVWKTLRSIDVLVIAGTGVLYEIGEGVLGWPFQLFKWCFLAKLAKRRIVFLSVGADGLAGSRTCRSRRERIRQRLGAALLTRSLSYADYRSYRDPLSRQRVGALLPVAMDDPVVPDLAFSLFRGLAPPLMSADPKRRVIGVGLYAVEGPEPAVELYLAVMERLVVRLHERGYFVRLFIGDGTYDEAILHTLWARLTDRVGDGISVVQLRDFETLLHQLAECDALIATRFHNLLLSMLLGTPVISISHMPKNDQLMAMMDLSNFCLALPTVNVAQILRCLADLEVRSEAVRAHLRLKSAEFAASLDDQYRYVVQLLHSAVAPS